MRTLLNSLCLLALSSSCSAVNVETPIGEINLKGHFTLFGYQTSTNEFNDSSSSSGTWEKSNVGVLATYQASNYVDVKLYATSDYPIDYGFIDIHLPIRKYNSGIRLGRVNRLNGLFSGFGPNADKMNFLPQATNADRIGRTFYRFDGVQVYASTVLGRQHTVGVEFTYGKPNIPDQGGIFDPVFFSVFNPHKSNISTNSPSPIINLNYTYKDWEVFADYYIMDIRIETEYNAVWDAETSSRMTGYPIEAFPEDYSIEVSKPVLVEEYPAYGMGAGISKAFGSTEFIYTYSRQVGKLSDPDLEINGESIGGRLVPEQHAFTVRHHIEEDMIYAGGSYFKSFHDSDDLYKVGVIAPDYVSYGKGLFIGLYKQLASKLSAIVEYGHNRGASFLSSTYQEPLESRKVWNVYSVSLNMVF